MSYKPLPTPLHLLEPALGVPACGASDGATVEPMGWGEVVSGRLVGAEPCPRCVELVRSTLDARARTAHHGLGAVRCSVVVMSADERLAHMLAGGWDRTHGAPIPRPDAGHHLERADLEQLWATYAKLGTLLPGHSTAEAVAVVLDGGGLHMLPPSSVLVHQHPVTPDLVPNRT